MTQSIPAMKERKEGTGADTSISGHPSLGDGRLVLLTILFICSKGGGDGFLCTSLEFEHIEWKCSFKTRIRRRLPYVDQKHYIVAAKSVHG